MKRNFARGKGSASYGVIILAFALCVLVVAPRLSSANSQTISITVVNNSSWVIRHIYLSAPNNNNWGPDQLNETSLSPGGTVTINASCSGPEIKVISEDQDGCFLSTVVSCAGDASWTITSNATPDCGN